MFRSSTPMICRFYRYCPWSGMDEVRSLMKARIGTRFPWMTTFACINPQNSRTGVVCGSRGNSLGLKDAYGPFPVCNPATGSPFSYTFSQSLSPSPEWSLYRQRRWTWFVARLRRVARSSENIGVDKKLTIELVSQERMLPTISAIEVMRK